MNKNFRLKVIVMLLFFCCCQSRLYPESTLSFSDAEPEISLDFKDADLKDVLKVFSMQSGLNFIASEGLQDRKITLYLDKAPLQDTMDQIFKANNLSYELDKGSNIFIVKDWGKITAETVTKVFNLKYASVSLSTLLGEKSSQMSCGGSSGGGSAESGIKGAVAKVLSPSGTVAEDTRTNSLIVTDIPSRMPIIAQLIASLDLPAPQILLEVEMLDVSKNTVDKLGVNWPSAVAGLNVPGQRNTAFPFFGNKAAQPITGTHFSTSVLTVIGANLTLDFLRTQTDTKFLARPKILTLNNETAEIKISTNESIGVKATTSGAEGGVSSSSVEAERTQTGVILRVTPQINVEDGQITMFIYPKVAEAVQGSVLTSNNLTFQYRDPEERSTKSTVRIKDGETVVLGGLIRNEVSNTEKKIPIFGDIPLLGALFRHKGSDSDKSKERELLVFITPHIIKEDNLEVAQAQVQTKKFTPTAREQDIASGIDRQGKINSILNNFERFSR